MRWGCSKRLGVAHAHTHPQRCLLFREVWTTRAAAHSEMHDASAVLAGLQYAGGTLDWLLVLFLVVTRTRDQDQGQSVHCNTEGAQATEVLPCRGGGGSVTATVSVTVTVPPPPPHVALSACPDDVPCEHHAYKGRHYYVS